MYCPKCKTVYPVGHKFCPTCEDENGMPIRLIEETSTKEGFNLNIGDANAISGGINMSDSHAVHNEDKSVHNTSNVSNVTNNTTQNITQVVAQKSEIEILQEKKRQYLNACNRVYEDNVLDPEEKVYLEKLRMELDLEETTANSILESVRLVAEKNVRKTTLNPIAKTKLKILSDNLQNNNVEGLLNQIDSLDVFVSKYAHDELSRKYYLVLAALKPEKCISLHEGNPEDSYWRSYWSYIAYLKLGSATKADEIIASIDKFADYPEDNITVLAVAGALINGNSTEATEYLSAVTGEYSPSLQRLVDSLYLILDPTMAAEIGATEEVCAFYLVKFFGEKDPKAKAKEDAMKKKANKEKDKLAKKKAKVEAEREAKAESKNESTLLTFATNGVSFNMVFVKGGSFTMGATSEMKDWDNDEKPTHQVTLSTYYIGQTEVTQALWKAVMGIKSSYFKGDNLAVELVSWNECQTFISKLNSLTGKRFRLPTEAEWEFAARGGNKSHHTQYSGSNNLDAVAWYGHCFRKPVATKQPNELDIYDMSGNVYDWCSDWYGGYSSSSQTNPTGPNSGTYRICRGGSRLRDARFCRSSSRFYYSPDRPRDGVGMRLCLSE